MELTAKELEIRNIILKINKLDEEIELLCEEFEELSQDCPHVDGFSCIHKNVPSFININCDMDICPLTEIEIPVKKKEEKKMDKDYIQVRVVMTKDYLIPVDKNYKAGDPTCINGWTLEQVKEDWFKRHSLGNYHASRDAHAVGNSEKFIKAIKIGVIK